MNNTNTSKNTNNTEEYETHKCGRCAHKKTLNDFGINKRTEKRYKTCVECREKVKLTQKAYREANKAKKRETDRKYREANKEKIRENDRKYREANKEKLKEKSKAYRESNKEKLAETHKQWAANNKEKLKAYRAEYYIKNKEKENAQAKQYREANKPRCRIIGIVKNSRMWDIEADRYVAENFITKQFIYDTIEAQENKCIYCSVQMELSCAPHADNLMTIERKDNSICHSQSNCVLACFKCNIQRSQRGSFEDFMLHKQTIK